MQSVMLGSYTFNGFAPRAMSTVAAGAKRNIVRDGSSAHSTGSPVGSDNGVDADPGSTNGMYSGAHLDLKRGRHKVMKYTQCAYESSSVRDRGYSPKKVLLRTPQGEAVVDLTSEIIADRSYEVTVGQNTLIWL